MKSVKNVFLQKNIGCSYLYFYIHLKYYSLNSNLLIVFYQNYLIVQKIH